MRARMGLPNLLVLIVFKCVSALTEIGVKISLKPPEAKVMRISLIIFSFYHLPAI